MHFHVQSLLFNQPRFETIVSELILVKNEALYAINNLKKWMQPQHVERNLVRLFSLTPPLLSGCYKEMYCAAKAD